MRIEGKVAVVTGAASGIGRALVRRFTEEGAAAVIAADLQDGPLRDVAQEFGATPMVCDVGKESDIQSLIARAEEVGGGIDIFCSNAGICEMGDENVSDDAWRRNWDIHVMAHVYAARALVEKMAAQGGGYFVNTASAAGLLSHVNSATYTVTKHAAVAFAEWLQINYGHRGIKVSVLCPQAVRTAMTAGREGTVAALDGMIEADAVADAVVQTMEEEAFLVLPHPIVLDYMRRKTENYDRWLGGMSKLKQKYQSAP